MDRQRLNDVCVEVQLKQVVTAPAVVIYRPVMRHSPTNKQRLAPARDSMVTIRLAFCADNGEKGFRQFAAAGFINNLFCGLQDFRERAGQKHHTEFQRST